MKFVTREPQSRQQRRHRYDHPQWNRIPAAGVTDVFKGVICVNTHTLVMKVQLLPRGWETGNRIPLKCRPAGAIWRTQLLLAHTDKHLPTITAYFVRSAGHGGCRY